MGIVEVVGTRFEPLEGGYDLEVPNCKEPTMSQGESEYENADEEATNPPSPERPEGGPDSENQPPAPPPESDPNQDPDEG